MARRTPSGTLVLLLVLLVAGSGAGAWWALRDSPDEPLEEQEETGMTRDDQRELLQEIGYLK